GRYLLPCLPALIIAGVVAISDLCNKMHGRTALIFAGVFASFAAGSVATMAEFIQAQNQYPFHVMNGRDCREAARWMRDNLPHDTRIVAYRIGALGYETDFHVVDLLGLADHRIAEVVAATPAFHPARRMGDDIPALREIIRNEHPTAMLGVQYADTVPLPERTLYGWRFVLVRAFPQGSDQQWTLYRRDDLQ
ncbi:MAG: hypothetical protein ABI579_06810, partial [Candidatus Sumerlaeota bacterium]